MSFKDLLGGKPGFDADAIRELSKLLTETGLTEIEVEVNGARSRSRTRARAADSRIPLT